MKAVGGRLHLLPEGEDVGALRHHDADAERSLAALADHEVGRVLEAAGDGGDVAEAKHAPVRFYRRFGYRTLAVEGAGDAQRNALRAGLDDARRRDRILLLQGVEDRLRCDAESRELRVAELHVDLRILDAVEVHLGDAGHLQEPLAQGLGHGFQLGVVGAVARHHVEDRIHVAELVVDVRADKIARQIGAEIGELLAQLIEELRHLARGGVVAEAHIHGREAGLRVGDHLVEVGQLLQPLLDAVRHLILHLLRGRAGPNGGDDHVLDREARVLAPAEAQE
jgi:hypothetical protein